MKGGKEVRRELRKRSHELALKLRKDYLLDEIDDGKINLHLIDGLLSEYAGGEEDSVSIIKLMEELNSE